MINGKTVLDEFNSACYIIHDDIETLRPKTMLYKYTTFEGLENILATKKLRYTDYRFFNDPTEIQFGKDIIKDTLYKAQIPSDNREDVLRTFNSIFDNFDNWFQIYVGCFSMSIKKLALWRYYACNGTGFAIGFNQNFQKINNSKEEYSLGKATIGRVIYGIQEANRLINRFLDLYVRALQRINHNNLRQFTFALASHLIPFLPLFKDESYSDENEIRLVFNEGTGIINPLTDEPFYFDDSVRDFIAINNLNFPFVKKIAGNKPVILEEFSKDDISEIWVGPCCEFAEARNSIRKLLSNTEYDMKNIKIQQAPLPLRYI